MQTVLITGGTGLIGRKLAGHLLRRNYRVIVFTRDRNHRSDNPNIEYAAWDVKRKMLDESALLRADAIIHLAGAGVVDKKWTAAYKKEIIDSRTKSSELLIEFLKKNAHKVKVIISASATGWYGPDRKNKMPFTETDLPDESFLAVVCRQWEASVEPARELGIRVCRLRTGIVLAKNGGAYAEFRKTLKFGIASILGGGRQMVSWIHEDDLCREYLFALENENIQGIYNAVAPAPVTNKELVLSIADKVKGTSYLPLHVPAFVLKLMLGGRSEEILKSVTVSTAKIQAEGFQFIFPSVRSAVNDLESPR